VRILCSEAVQSMGSGGGSISPDPIGWTVSGSGGPEGVSALSGPGEEEEEGPGGGEDAMCAASVLSRGQG